MKTKTEIEKMLNEYKHIYQVWRESLKDDVLHLKDKHAIENIIRISIVLGKIELPEEIINEKKEN